MFLDLDISNQAYPSHSNYNDTVSHIDNENPQDHLEKHLGVAQYETEDMTPGKKLYGF